MADLFVVTQKWQEVWPDCLPKPYELRKCAASALLRLQVEQWNHAGIALKQVNTLISELVSTASNGESSVLVITVDWNSQGTDKPGTRSTGDWDVVPAPIYWQTINFGNDPAYPVWQHLYLSEVTWSLGVLDTLLEQCLSDCNDDVMICGTDLTWIVAPRYDFVETFVSSAEVRGALRSNGDLAWT